MTLRTLTGAMTTAVGGSVTQPGYLVELAFADGLARLSTFGTVNWNSVPWVGASFTVDGFDADQSGAQITLVDPVAAFAALAFGGNGIRNRSVKIWKAYAGALAAGDPVLIFAGVGDAVRAASGRVTISCARHGETVLYSPQKRIGPATGFNFLAAPGTVLQWGDVSITLSDGR